MGPIAVSPQSEAIARLTELVVRAAHPRRIILFGSEARGQASEDSDLDLLVIEDSVPDRAAEMVRLNRLLRPLRLAVDLLVASEEKFQYWRDTPGNVYYEAATEGQVLYEAP